MVVLCAVSDVPDTVRGMFSTSLGSHFEWFRMACWAFGLIAASFLSYVTLATWFRPQWRWGREKARLAAGLFSATAFLTTVMTGWHYLGIVVVLLALAASFCSINQAGSSFLSRVFYLAVAYCSIFTWGVWYALVAGGGLHDPSVVVAGGLIGAGLSLLGALVLSVSSLPNSERANEELERRSQRWILLTFMSTVAGFSWLGLRSSEHIKIAGLAVLSCGALYVLSRTALVKGAQAALVALALLFGSLGGFGLPTTASNESVNKESEAVAEPPLVTLIPGASAASSYGSEFDKCAQLATQFLKQKDCYSSYFVSQANDLGVDEALALMVDVHKDNAAGRDFRNHCHEVLHDVAKDQAQKLGAEKLFGSWVVSCTGGFAHGVLVAYTHEQTWDRIKTEFPSFCDTITTKVVDALVASGKEKPEDTGWIEWNCNHMIGHIAYENSRNDLPSGSALCLAFEKESDKWRNCGAGFFMEYFLDMTRSLNGLKLPSSASEVYAQCAKVDPDIQEPCYSEGGAAMFASANGVSLEAFKNCAAYVPSGEMRDACYGGVSRLVTVSNGFVPSKMRQGCVEAGSVEALARDLCGNEIAGALVMETNAPEEAEKTCREVVVDAALLERCLTRVEGVSAQIEGSNLTGGTGAVQE
jgi:hypothetical protein